MLRPRLASTALAVSAALALAGCELPPTEAPIIDSTWRVPADSTRIAVASLLPSDVSIVDGAFAFSLPAASVRKSLTEMCDDPLCSFGFDGSIPVPLKPAFRTTLAIPLSLPADVSSASLASGTVRLSLANGFVFDPLRPNGDAAPYGSMTITISSGGRTLYSRVIDGASQGLPAGQTTELRLDVGPGTLEGSVTASIVLDSPEGAATTLSSTDYIGVSATARDLRIGEARVALSKKTITAAPMDLDVKDVDQSIANRVKSGGFVVGLDNGFDAAGTLKVVVTAPGVTIEKTMSVPAGQSSQRIDFTGTELRSFLGHSGVQLNVSGEVSAPNGSALVRPPQALVIKSSLEFSLSTQG